MYAHFERNRKIYQLAIVSTNLFIFIINSMNINKLATLPLACGWYEYTLIIIIDKHIL